MWNAAVTGVATAMADVTESDVITRQDGAQQAESLLGVDQQHMALLVDMWSTTRRQVRRQPTLNVSE
ncbi:MAG: hypothetical protein QOF52_1412 [Propionibacteriaceae bacterium]|nr:hypothetical protein [Propionibacteriaceae bacterium]